MKKIQCFVFYNLTFLVTGYQILSSLIFSFFFQGAAGKPGLPGLPGRLVGANDKIYSSLEEVTRVLDEIKKLKAELHMTVRQARLGRFFLMYEIRFKKN